MLDASYYASLGLADVLDKVLAGQRLSAEDGMALFACPDITAVGALAHHARCRMHGDKTSYVVNRQINYTNVCVNGCVGDIPKVRQCCSAVPSGKGLGTSRILAQQNYHGKLDHQMQ